MARSRKVPASSHQGAWKSNDKLTLSIPRKKRISALIGIHLLVKHYNRFCMSKEMEPPFNLPVNRRSRPDDIEPAVDAVTDFLRQMLRTSGVEAVAFLAVREPSCPITLSIEVFTQLERGNEKSTNTVGAVTTADAALANRLSSFLPSGLRFVNTARMDLAALKQRLTKRWADDPALNLLCFVTFERE